MDQDLREVRKITRLAIEDQQARLRRDRDAHLVGDLLPGATDERFLRDEHLDVLLELALEVARKEAEVGDASIENVAPGRGERPRAQALAAALDDERLADHPRHEGQEHRADEKGRHARHVDAAAGISTASTVTGS